MVSESEQCCYKEKENIMKAYEKILGGLLGGAVGDAMGAATEMRTTQQIADRFGGYVTTIQTPPDDTFAHDSAAGSVTDDFSLAYYTAETIAKHKGKIDSTVAKEALVEWSRHPEYFRYAGPTTKGAVKRLLGETVEEQYPFLAYDCGKATNGSAMKISPVGLFHPGDLDSAIKDAVTICMPTHNNNLSISGACAVASAVSCAMCKDVNVYDIVEAGLYGARKGFALGSDHGIVVAGASVEKRINLAVELALRSSLETAIQDIADYVGNGLHISEAVPAVFGLIVAAKGNTMDSIYAGVNIGYDTDTIATMIGAIVGTMNGVNSFPSTYLSLIQSANPFDLVTLATDIERMNPNG